MKNFRNRLRQGGRFRRGMGGKFSRSGEAGMCVCVNPNCKMETPHIRGQPCYQQVCPKCGSPMVRKYGA